MEDLESREEKKKKKRQGIKKKKQKVKNYSRENDPSRTNNLRRSKSIRGGTQAKDNIKGDDYRAARPKTRKNKVREEKKRDKEGTS